MQYAPSTLGAALSGDGGFDAHHSTNVLVDDDGEVVSGQQLWENKFAFRKDMVPSFISEEFGRKVIPVRLHCSRTRNRWMIGIDLFHGEEFELH